MTIENANAIREAVTEAMSSLSVDELREIVMDPYKSFKTEARTSVAA